MSSNFSVYCISIAAKYWKGCNICWKDRVEFIGYAGAVQNNATQAVVERNLRDSTVIATLGKVAI
jgi:hypothetical protein